MCAFGVVRVHDLPGRLSYAQRGRVRERKAREREREREGGREGQTERKCVRV